MKEQCVAAGVAEAGFRGHFLGFPMDVFAPLAAAPLAAERPRQWRGRGIALRPFTGLDADLRRPVLGFVAVLFVVGALVLLVACVNVAIRPGGVAGGRP